MKVTAKVKAQFLKPGDTFIEGRYAYQVIDLPTVDGYYVNVRCESNGHVRTFKTFTDVFITLEDN